jgi:hypothetical protein
MKYVPLCKPLLIQKLKIPLNGDFLLFKEKNLSDTIDQQITGV